MFHILLAEDNPGDALLVEEAFEDDRLLAEISLVADGQEALDFLHDDSKKLPDLVLLDLNMPKVDGHQVLEEMKADKILAQIPVIVLTSSEAPSDKERAQRAHGYLTKPVDMKAFFLELKNIEEFFLTITRAE